MPLDDLVKVIETLQQRIRDHGDSLRQNEIRTRVALIDPLLTALGWDVADPGFGHRRISRVVYWELTPSRLWLARV